MFSLYLEMRYIFYIYLVYIQIYYITCKITKALCLDKKEKRKRRRKKKKEKKSAFFSFHLLLNRPCLNAAVSTWLLPSLTKTDWQWSLERTGPRVTSQVSQTPFAFSRHFLWKSANSVLWCSSGWCTVLTCSLWALPEVNIVINNFFFLFFFKEVMST